MLSARLCLPFSWVLFLRSWRNWTVLALGLVLTVPASYHSRTGMAISCIGLFIVVLTLFNALSLVDPQQQGPSFFPSFLLQLPISDLELVLWPMLVTAFVLGAAGLLIAASVLVSLHSLRDTWWLAPHLASTGVLFQAAYWLPLRRPEWRMSLNLVAIVAIAGGPIALGFDIANPVALSLTYGAILVGSILVSARGISKVRHGLVGIGAAERRPYVIRELPPFQSRVATQRWLEEARNGKVMIALTITAIAVFVGCGILSAFGAPDFVGFQGQRLAVPPLVCAGLCLVFPAFIGYGGCCGSESDNLAKDRSIIPFLALRPLTDEQIFEAKIRMAVRVAIRIAYIQIGLAVGILALPMPLGDQRVSTIVSLAHALTPGQAVGVVGLFLLATLIGVKGAISSVWASMGRLSTFASAAIGFIPLAIGGTGVGWLATNMDQLPAFLRWLPWLVWIDAGVKMALLTWAIPQLRRRNLVSDATMVKWAAGCAVTGVVLFVVGNRAVPTAFYSRPALCAQIFCLLPLGRIALTPIFIHRGRHQ